MARSAIDPDHEYTNRYYEKINAVKRQRVFFNYCMYIYYIGLCLCLSQLLCLLHNVFYTCKIRIVWKYINL